MQKIYLPEITLCAIDTANVILTRQALEHSVKGCIFGDIVFVTSERTVAPFRTIIVSPFVNMQEVESFWVQKLPSYINTPFILFVQYDGYVINPSSWQPEFLEYDYVGAKWAWRHDGLNVGNSGFSLMSKRLLNTWGSPENNPSLIFTDEYLCRTLRPHFETEYNIRFAPESIADLFSYENSLPRQPTFGFHGLFNLWRHNDDEQMNRIAHEIADYTVLSPGYVKIIAQYYLMRKFNPLRALYARLRQKQNKQDVLRQFVQMFNEPFARECITVCENLMQEGPRIGIPPVVCPPQTDIKQPYEEIDARGRIFPWER